MRFKCFLNGREYLGEANVLGGYSSVVIWPAPDGEKTQFQLFETAPAGLINPSSDEFLERAARVSLAWFEAMVGTGDRITMIPYDENAKIFTGDFEIQKD